jgi:hypothetical protein
MRIDVSNILLAGQIQANRPQNAVKEQATFQPLDFSKSMQDSERKTTSSPAAGGRLGSRLDIKV